MSTTRERKRPTDWMVATESAVVVVDGKSETIVRNETHARRDDPLVREFPDYFTKLERPRADLEDADAAPGRPRGST